MSSSSVLACLILLGTLQVGQPSFTIGDKKFEHVWHTKANMPSIRSDMTATTVDDAIYIIGGCTLDQANTFDTKLPAAPRPRYRHAAAAANKKIYLFGGTGSSGTIVGEIDVFDTTAGTWSTLAQSMPGATTDLSAFTYAGKIYTLGGYDANWKALDTVRIFNPLFVAGAWTLGPSLLQGRGDAFAAVIGDEAYVLGGFHDENNFVAPVADLEMLNLKNGNAWVARNNMSVARGDKAVAALNNILHVVGGETKSAQGHSVPLKDVEAYDPITNAWYFGGDIPSKRFRFTAAAHGKSIFIFGGQGYLVGKYASVGSKYPLVDVVEEYSETVVSGDVTHDANGVGASSMDFGLVFLMLATVFGVGYD